VHDLDPGDALEQLHREVVGRADAGGTIADLAGILLGVVDQLLDGIDRRRGPDDEEILRLTRKDERREVLHRIVRKSLVDAGIGADFTIGAGVV
jgi:hypothetical protein